jgi:hypothetical protein
LFYVNANGNVGIGIAPSAKLDVMAGFPAILIGVDISETARTNSATHYGGIGLAHYTLTEEPVATVYGNSGSAANVVNIGGGSSSFNAATSIGFFTGANNTTTTGPERMSITSAGNVGIGTTTPTAALSVVAITGAEYIVKLSSANGAAAFGLHQNGHLSIYGSSVSLATCANASVSANSKRDTAFTVNFTGANSSCGFTFGDTFDVQPVCVCTTKNTGNNGCEMSQISTSSATFVPQSGAWASGDMMNVICLGAH